MISVSRRTDIPAFYGDWFMRRIHDGIAEYKNPFNQKLYSVSLEPSQVLALVFWSKDYEPFLKHLPQLEDNYRFYFHFTITGLPKSLEALTPKITTAIDTFRFLAQRYSPDHVLWRFDPIILANKTSVDYYMRAFAYLTEQLEGFTKRCCFSFVQDNYKKVKRQFDLLASSSDFKLLSAPFEEKKKLLDFMIRIADKKNIRLYSCCQDHHILPPIQKAHCIDKDLLADLYPEINFNIKKAASRKECGCYKSIDIGRYDTCPHGCIYCYANNNLKKAQQYLKNHNIKSFSL